MWMVGAKDRRSKGEKGTAVYIEILLKLGIMSFLEERW